MWQVSGRSNITDFEEVVKSKSLAWSSVLLALGNIKGEVVDRPKALGDIRGVTYIYGMFYRFGLIDVPDEIKEKIRFLSGRRSRIGRGRCAVHGRRLLLRKV